MTKAEIGQILKTLRIQSGKTQKEVAKALGKAQQVIGHWETGYCQPSINSLLALCDIYGMSIEEAFKRNKENLTADPPEFTEEERLLIKAYRTISTNERIHLKWLLDRLSPDYIC